MTSPGDSAAAPHEAPSSARQKELAAVSQLDFDIDFFDAILLRAPDYSDVLRRQGEQLSRKGLHHRALAIDRRLVRLLPSDCVARYNLACSLAQCGLTREALASLRRALECGYDDFEFLEQDRDLASLRDDQGFQDLIQEFSPRR